METEEHLLNTTEHSKGCYASVAVCLQTGEVWHYVLRGDGGHSSPVLGGLRLTLSLPLTSVTVPPTLNTPPPHPLKKRIFLQTLLRTSHGKWFIQKDNAISLKKRQCKCVTSLCDSNLWWPQACMLWTWHNDLLSLPWSDPARFCVCFAGQLPSLGGLCLQRSQATVPAKVREKLVSISVEVIRPPFDLK